MPNDQKSTGAEYPRFVNSSGAGVRKDDIEGHAKRTHICHTPRHARQQSAFREVHCDVEIGDVGVSTLVQQYIVRLQVAAVS